MAKMQANELTNVRVKKISLVDRAAIRQPFRIQKQDRSTHKAENDMSITTRLRMLFKDDSAKPKGPFVAAVCVLKSADQTGVKARLELFGLSVAKAEDDGNGFIVYKQPGCPEGAALDECVVYKAHPDVAMLISGVAKDVQKGLLGSAEAVQSTMADRFTSSGVLPGISAALDAVSCSLWSEVYKASTPAEASAAVGRVFDEASGYLQALVGAIPSVAFKSEMTVYATPKKKGEAGGKITLELGPAEGYYGLATIRFPMEPGPRTNNSGLVGRTVTGPNGSSQGVDPLKGNSINYGMRSDGVEIGNDDNLPGEAEIETMKSAGKSRKTKDDGAGEDAGDGGSDEGDEGDVAGSSKKKGTKTVVKGPDGAGGKGDGTFTSRNMTSSTNGNSGLGEPDDDAVLGTKGKDSGVHKGELASIMTVLKGISGKLDDLTGDVEGLTTRTAKNEENTSRLRAAFKSTVGTVEADADVETKKGASNGHASPPMIDTAVNREWISQ